LPGLFASAQIFTANDPGPGSVDVTGKWQFHTGDDMGWAQLGFDDSGWEQLSSNASWGEQTHPEYTRFAWYRKRIEIANQIQPLAIMIPPVDDAYKIYWNGRKIGTYGGLSPHAKWWSNGRRMVYSPDGANGVLALRICKAELMSTDDVSNLTTQIASI
jgi:hypothetical protein